MFTLASICALVCSSIATQAESADTPTFSRAFETQLPNPVTLVLGSTLYTVSKTKQYLRVNSTDVKCKLKTDPFDENIEGRINAAALVDDKKIVVWGIQKSEPQGDNRLTCYTLLVVDPLACSYKVVSLPEDRVPNDHPVLQPQLVVKNTLFLMFYPTQRGCYPCQYWGGNSLEASERKFPYYHNGVPSRQLWFKRYNGVNYDKLFHAYNFENDTAMIQVLDVPTFSGGWTAWLADATVDAASVSYGNYQNTAICSITPSKNRREVECARLTSRLQIGSSWKLPLRDNLTVYGVSIEVDKVGNTFIGVIDSRQLRGFIYDVDSELVADLDFGKIDEKYNHREVNGILMVKEFCLVAVAYTDANMQDTRHVVECIDVSKYLNSTST